MKIASELIKKDIEVYFITDERFFNYKTLFEGKEFFNSPKFKIISTPVQSFSQSKSIFHFVHKLICSFVKVAFSFCKIKPNVVVGFGGYASFIPLLIAVLSFKKIIIHEQNIVLGKVNKIFAKFAKTILLSFPETSQIPKKLYKKIKNKILISGYPTFVTDVYNSNQRKALHDLATKQEIVILITGGSQGANFFSIKIVNAIKSIALSFPLKTFTVYHQVRSQDIEKTLYLYSKANIPNININIQPIFNNISEILYKTDIAIIRGGAGSIIENALLKVFSIIIPLPNSADNHQLQNAKTLATNNAAVMLEEKNYKTAKLAFIISKTLQDATFYFPIINAASNTFNTNASDIFVNVILYNDLKF